MLLKQLLALVDLETTGPRPSADRITEAAVLRLENGEEQRWESLFNVDVAIPAFVQQLTGISAKMLAGAPRFCDRAAELFQLLDGAILVAHNARFDAGFLKQSFTASGYDYRPRILCTLKLARALYPHWPKHGLDALCEQIAYHRDTRHRAMADVLAMKAFLDYAIADVGEAEVMAQFEAQLQRPSLPPQLPPEQLSAVPDRPGVYRFYGDGDALLYVGKSVSMRKRVLSHFRSDMHSSKAQKMLRRLTRIEVTETAGELGALLLESQQIKTLSPLYNRQLRRQRELCVVQLQPDEQGYLHPVFIGDEALDSVEGIFLFRHRKQATALFLRIAREQQLCLRRLGLESGRGNCFAYQLKRCAGACCGEQSAAEYNARLLSQLATRKLESWPFSGPVLIREQRADRRRTDWFLVDHWRIFGCFRGRRPSQKRCHEALSQAPAFDFDLYCILLEFRKSREWLPLPVTKS